MDPVDVEERKKMFELMKDRELKGTMDWMYRGEKPDTEEYLLGKSVDKMVSEATGTQNDEGSKSIFSERIKANVALDMAAKVREDPLFAIRKKEEDARKKLLENPVKMKQLEKLVEQQRERKISLEKKSKKSKKEKKKKKKKKKGKDSDSDSDSSGSEDDLVNQYLSILTQKKKTGEQPTQEQQGKQKDRPGNNHREHDHPQPHPHRPLDRRREEEHTRQWDDRRDSRDVRGPRPNPDNRERRGREQEQRERSPKLRKRKQSSSSEDSDRPAKMPQRGDSSDREVQKKMYGLIKNVRNNMPDSSNQSANKTRKSRSASKSKSRSPKRKDRKKHKKQRKQSSSSSRSRSPVRRRSRTPPRKKRSRSPNKKKRSRSPPKKPLSAAEKAKRVEEMMADAKWRDQQRSQNVQRYKDADKKESSRLESYQGDAGFLNSMMSDHAAASSVEDRLKRNKYNIQRTRAALDKNFTER